MELLVRKRAVALLGALAVTAAAVIGFTALQGRAQTTQTQPQKEPPVEIEVFAPGPGDNAGIDGIGWFVDLEVDFPPNGLKSTGFNGFQLTGPPPHADAPPFPGSFSPGQDDRLPGLVVLLSTTKDVDVFKGPGTNLANLFNLTGVTDRSRDEIELWDTWIISKNYAGKDIDSILRVAEVKDLDGNGIFDDAPDVVPDSNNDGRINDDDLEALGLASEIVKIPFHIG